MCISQMTKTFLCFLLLKLSGLERDRGGAQNLKICNQNKHQNLLFKKEIKIGETQNLELFIFPPCPLVNAHRNKFLQTTSPERNAAMGIVHLFLPKNKKVK